MSDLIVFAEDFGGLPSSTQHLIRRMAKRHRILWVNSIGLRQPRWTLKDAKRLLSKLVCLTSKRHVVTQFELPDSDNTPTNIHVTTLLTIPAPSSRFARWLAKQMLSLQLKRKIGELDMHDPVLWSSLPTTADLLDSFPLWRSVYYCGDDFSSLAGVDHQTVTTHESKLIQQADCVLVASERLMDKFPVEKTHFVPHGVDLELFSQPCSRAPDLPNDYQYVCGFYGSLSHWLDYQMIETVARQLTQWAFVFIGPCEFDRNPLPKLSNVFYLGKKPHALLPSYSQHWSVSWLPFVNNQQIEFCNPLKLLEYLAAGRPVLTKRFPALEPFRSNVLIAENSQQMIEQLQNFATISTLEAPDLSQQSWDARADYVEQLVERL
ncbi:TPA: glycosyltransferase family 1 protein [Vibrio vulnificus]|nr:glycosyltransferase family 1 protein [Vibrio vulnificus]